MVELKQDRRWTRGGVCRTMRRLGAALSVGILAAICCDWVRAPTPKLEFTVQQLPFDPRIDSEECVITVITVVNGGRIPLTGVTLTGEFAGAIHHCGTTERGGAAIAIDCRTSNAGTTLVGHLGHLPVGGQLSIGVVSAAPLAQEAQVISRELVGTRASAWRSGAGYMSGGLVLAALAFLGAVGYILLLIVRRLRSLREWTRLLASYVMEMRRSFRHPEAAAISDHA